jgi:hypothetical protein
MTYDQGLWITTGVALLMALYSVLSWASAPNMAQAVRVEAQATITALRAPAPKPPCPPAMQGRC